MAETFLGRKLKKRGDHFESSTKDGWPLIAMGPNNGGRWYCMVHFATPAALTVQVFFMPDRQAAEDEVRRKLRSIANQLETLEL